MEPDQINELFRTVGRIEEKVDQANLILTKDARRIDRLERQMGKIMLLITVFTTPFIYLGKKLTGLL